MGLFLLGMAETVGLRPSRGMEEQEEVREKEPEEQYLQLMAPVEEAQELVVKPLEVVEDQVKGQVEVQ